MNRIRRTVICAGLLGPLAVAACAQEWYAGLTGGYGFAPSLTANKGSLTATTGIDNGYVVGAFFGGEARSTNWGGEIRYLYRQSDLKIESGGTSARFSADTTILHYDFVYSLRSKELPVRPFVAFGAGMSFLRGTGSESANQPLGNVVALTHTMETLPIGDGGFGIKANIRKNWQFRAEVHDYFGPAPSKVITAAPGTTVTGWLNDIIATASIGYRW